MSVGGVSNGPNFHVNKNRKPKQLLKRIWKLASKCFNRRLKACEKTEISLSIQLSRQTEKEISSIVHKPLLLQDQPFPKEQWVNDITSREISIKQTQTDTLLPVSKIGPRLFKIGEEELQFDKNSKYTSAFGQTGKIRGPIETKAFGKVVIKRVRINETQDRTLGVQISGDKVSSAEDWKQEVEMHKDLQEALGKNIVQLYGVSNQNEYKGKDSVTREYMVLEHLEKTFKTKISELDGNKKNDKYLELINLIEDMHSKGFAHGDLHPKNIMVREDNALVLIDFGKTAKEGDVKFSDTKLRDKRFLKEMLPFKLISLIDLYRSGNALNKPVSKLLFDTLEPKEKEIILKFSPSLSKSEESIVSKDFPRLEQWGAMLTDSGFNEKYDTFLSNFNTIISDEENGVKVTEGDKDYCFSLIKDDDDVNEYVKVYVKQKLGYNKNTNAEIHP
ncbi:MAG: protein kinase domain-containing protein [Candidatus Marinamargulisbacteria bacterium]